MSEELIFHCDRSENHRLSYEKASGATSDPVKAGWLIVDDKTTKIGLIIEVQRMRTETLTGDLHFCSDRCLVGWFEQRIKIFEKQEQSTEKENDS